MNAEDQNQDFEKLQHLLKLKRYESPPPRYFNDFSTQIVSRIRAGRTGSRYESFENIVTHTPWLSRWWQKLERQPGLSGAVAAIVCGLMVAGVFLMEQTTPSAFNPPAPDGNFTATPDAAPVDLNPFGNSLAAAPLLVSSTNALLTGPNLFEHIVPGSIGRPMQPIPAAGMPIQK